MKYKTVTIIDYGMGNIGSLTNAFNYLGAKVKVSSEPDKIEKSSIVILPGVGSFHKAMKIIKKNSIDCAIKNIISKGNYLLCICLGMQLLASESVEDKFTKGLGIIPNKVKKFTLKETKNKIPHVGFNQVFFEKKNKLFKGLSSGTDFYFVHSHRILPEKLTGDIAKTNYGVNFISSFVKDNIYATQFHPEKSQSNGIKLLDNFLNIT
jgi:imidazole glycerol-phosphate synthase subunit HisH